MLRHLHADASHMAGVVAPPLLLAGALSMFFLARWIFAAVYHVAPFEPDDQHDANAV